MAVIGKTTINKCWWGCRKRELLYIVSGNVNWCNHCRKLRKLEMESPYTPAIAFLDIYPKEMKTLIWKDICTPMFTAALFMIDKMRKQPKCPSTRWMDEEDVIHTHTHTHTLSPIHVWLIEWCKALYLSVGWNGKAVWLFLLIHHDGPTLDTAFFFGLETLLVIAGLNVCLTGNPWFFKSRMKTSGVA